MSTISVTLPGFPDDLVQAVAREAELSADLVVEFLNASGVLPNPKARAKAPVGLPENFLLELAAALRSRQWEEQGLLDRIGEGLPPPAAAIREILRRAAEEPESFAEEGGRPSSLPLRVMAAAIDRLSWSGRAELGADVVLGDDGGEELLEALADFLWMHRHLAPGGG